MATIIKSTNQYDITYYNNNAVYNTAWEAASGDMYSRGNLIIGQLVLSPSFRVGRSYFWFDTSSLPSDLVIVSAKLWLYNRNVVSNYNSAFYIKIQRGTELNGDGIPVVHHAPIVYEDYSKGLVSGDGGEIDASTIPEVEGYFSIDLNEEGIDWINKGAGAISKFCLRTDKDINGVEPTEDVNKYLEIRGAFGADESQYPYLEIFFVEPVITTLAPNLVEDGIANLRLNLEDMAGLTIDSVGYYCDENATPSTEYIETGWRAEIETGIYNIYVKTLPAGETTLYVQAWADDSDGNRYTGNILSFDIPSEPEYTKLPDIIFPELPEIPAMEIDLPNINYNVGLDLYLDRTYTRKDLEELRRKCINYEKNYTDFCLVLNHNILLVKNFLQSAYNNGVLGGENEMFAKIYPSQQLTPLYLESLEPNDFKGIINRFINNNTSNSMGLNHNFDLFKEWLNDYNYTSDGYKASYITPREEIITNNEPTVKYLTSKINRLQREVSTSSREIMHNFNLIKEIIQ